MLLAAASGCVTEVEPPPSVTLPKEAFRYERFIQSYGGLLTADRVTVQAVTAYRKDIALAVTEGYHLKRELEDRIELVNKDPTFKTDPLRLMFRELKIEARQSITIVFSDLPLLRKEDPPVLLLFQAEGIARLRSDDEDLIADKLIMRNDEVRGFDANGRPLDRAAMRPVRRTTEPRKQ